VREINRGEAHTQIEMIEGGGDTERERREREEITRES
jgi:hypothetical protein